MNKDKPNQPTLALDLELDELEVDATRNDVEQGDYTRVTKLV